ncbi:DinB family protein [Paenibacillus sp. 1011MAR3C5]|uniref:DinB family protein n=1 Tax=Paenibacillus sp. 1011MAR3C5 TaxID=1675787 RepID=UPI000E6D232F|nr:DinB family protein [Paenibacillus sp. 1011MAR3C5]RJE86153.1 DinB family protein [Paenibacillus sp. 1011MAR3C5]
MSTIATVLPVWEAIQSRFHKMVKGLPEEDLSLAIGPASIGYMLRHNAEVEYMFAEWFFGQMMPEGLKMVTSRGPKGGGESPTFANLSELVALLEASNGFLIQAMKELPDEQWRESVESPMGPSTPLEAIGRLMYHTGIHAGQISLIQKNAPAAKAK